MPLFKKRSGQSRIGLAAKRRYDLPLVGGAGSAFLRLLIGLMTILGVLALALTLALHDAGKHWQGALENRATIELPAQTQDGGITPQDELAETAAALARAAAEEPGILAAEVMSRAEMGELVSPWLGDVEALEDVPLPALVSLELDPDIEVDFSALQEKLETIDERARLERHEDWVAALSDLAGTVNFAAGMTTLLVGIIILCAVAGSVRSKLAEHKHELELLHLIGAGDSYIAAQMQRRFALLSLQGGLAGLVAAFALLGLAALGKDEAMDAVMPSLTLSGPQLTILALFPLLLAALALGAARLTTLRVLEKMP